MFDPVPAPIDRKFLAQMPLMLNLVPDHGNLDLTFTPSGPVASFDEWSVGANRIEIAKDLPVSIAALDSLRVEAGGRPPEGPDCAPVSGGTPREAATRLNCAGASDRFVERLGEGVPAEDGALDAHRELHDPLERLEVAERHVGVAGSLVDDLDRHQ
jgi:hypothetical protein